MGRWNTHSAGRLDDAGKKQPKAKRGQDEDREYFESCVEEMEEDGKRTMPLPNVVKYHDLVEKLWGWDKLLPRGYSVSWSEYIDYLEAYYANNDTAKGLSIAAIAETCRTKEEQLVSEWRRVESKMEMILPMSKSIILSCLIHQCASSVINTAGCGLSAVSHAALWCIAKEADLTCELLRHGADPCDDYLIQQSTEIRMCALSLMNCSVHNFVAACAAMLGMAKEAEMMCEWMRKNHMLLDVFDDPIPDAIVDSHKVRLGTLDVMVDMLEESSGAAGGHKIDGPANTTKVRISDALNSHNQNIKGVEKSNKGKWNEGNREANHRQSDLLGKLWGWESLFPLYSSVEWSNYSSYLEEYYYKNAFKFVVDAANQNPENLLLDPAAQAVQITTTAGSSLPSDVAKCCLKMEKELVSKWKTRVRRCRGDTLSVSTIIQSSLIKERALAISGTGGEFSVSSAVASVCITKEADLMCELLKHGAEKIDDIIQHSCLIRMCALGLANLKGHQSITSAAAMVGMAKEAIKMCDWMKRENKLLTFGLFEPCGLQECRLIRISTLDVMIRILLESSFPSKSPNPDNANIPSTPSSGDKDGDEDEDRGQGKDNNVLVEGDELWPENKQVEARELQDLVEWGAEEEQPDVESDEKRVEGRTGLSEWFYEISKEAQGILDRIEAGDDVPKEDVKSLCRKILSARDWISSTKKKTLESLSLQ